MAPADRWGSQALLPSLVPPPPNIDDRQFERVHNEESSMSDHHLPDHPSTGAPDDPEAEREDWDPMAPETTVPDPEADQAVSEEEWQQRTAEETPA
jgi:hypothetical protein